MESLQIDQNFSAKLICPHYVDLLDYQQSEHRFLWAMNIFIVSEKRNYDWITFVPKQKSALF